MRNFAIISIVLMFVLVIRSASADTLFNITVELNDQSIGSFSYVVFSKIIGRGEGFTEIWLPGPDRKQGTKDDTYIDAREIDPFDYFYGEILLLSVSNNLLSPNVAYDNKKTYWGYYSHNTDTSCQDYITEPFRWYDYAGYSGRESPPRINYELNFGNVGDGIVVSAGFQPYDYHTPVPEPSALLLFGTGLVGLAGVSRRKKA